VPSRPWAAWPRYKLADHQERNKKGGPIEAPFTYCMRLTIIGMLCYWIRP
jgi:hypothetical protein